MAIKFRYLTIVENGGIYTARGDIGQFTKGRAVKQSVVEELRKCMGTRVGPTPGQFPSRLQAQDPLYESGLDLAKAARIACCE